MRDSLKNLLDNPDLSLKAKGLYVYILNKPFEWNGTINNMIADLREGRDSIRGGILELIKKDLLSYHKNNDGTVLYVIKRN